MKISLLATRMEQNETASRLGELTTKLARGDDPAWAEFHRHYGPRVFRQLLAATQGDHDLASEALQQTYLRVARQVRPCDSEPMFLGWLRIVARSALHDCWRRRRSFWRMLQRRHADPSETAFSSDEEENVLLQLDAALAQLEAGDRALLEEKYFSGHSIARLAEKLTISPKAVESRLGRARAELRRHLTAALSRHD